ncbi:MAG: hypothetical protein M3376_06405 [Actinomycetota bacterium]|nr:hypothetical protein [Actinomycetota bacterium]
MDTIRRAYRSGALRAFRPGGVRRYVIMREDLIEWAFGKDSVVAPVPPRAQLRSIDSEDAGSRRPAPRRRSRASQEPGSVDRLLEIERRGGG